jgi:prepilin-type processing-associated H-X9-DG protein
MRGNGIYPTNRVNDVQNLTNIRDVSDGTSNTFAMGEMVVDYCYDVLWWFYDCTHGSMGPPLNYVPEAVRSGSTSMENYAWSYDNQGGGFYSRHPGGANFGLADGSVRFVSNNIDLLTYRHLGNMGDGFPVQVP